MKDALVLIAFVLAWLFPVFYAYKHRIKNKMLFLFSSYGAELIISLLIAGVGVPFYVFSIYMLPQLIELDIRFGWIGRPIYWVTDYFWVLTPLLLFIIPRGIYVRYSGFFAGDENT